MLENRWSSMATRRIIHRSGRQRKGSDESDKIGRRIISIDGKYDSSRP
jgi:hypothetical protein